MRLRFPVLPILFSVGVMWAQEAPLRGPLEGFTFDLPTKSIRPVIGSLGSASLGVPILTAAYASVAPHQNYALTFRGDRCALVSGLDAGQTSEFQVPGTFSLPEGIMWSGDGATAILYSRTENWIRELTGLPLSPNAGPALSLSPLGGSLSSIAADLHGTQIAIGMRGDTGAIFRLTSGGTFAVLSSTVNPLALALSDDGQTLYALDSTTGQVFEQVMSDLSSQFWPLDGLLDPIALTSSRDANHQKVIYVAGRSDRLLKVFNASTRSILASVPLNFQPDRIDSLGGGSFLLDARMTGDDILWSFTNAPQPSVFFVPAIPIELRGNRRR